MGASSADADPEATNSISSSAHGNAESKSKQSTIAFFFRKQLKSTAERIDFIHANAPKTFPVGYLFQTKLAEEESILMRDAACNSNYDLAHRSKLERDRLLAAAALEKKMFTDCTWAKDYAESKLEQLRKHEKFVECMHMEDVARIADAYLNGVSDEDVEAFNVMLQSSLSVKHQVGRADVEMTDAEEASSGIATSLTDESADVEMLSELDEEGSEEDDKEVTQHEKGDTVDVITKPKAKGARDRKPKVYISAKADICPNAMKKPPKLELFRHFISETCHNVYHKDQVTIVDVSREHYIMTHGYLYCDCCKIQVDWRNRSKHLVTQKHINNKKNAETVAQDLEVARPMLQQRIMEENLVGRTYSNEKLESTMTWLRIACAGNWSTKSVDENRVSH